jgi:membrane-associated protease RseP (regulator of RpoE activity)
VNDIDLSRQLRAEIGDLFLVEDITSDFPTPGAVRFRGRLLVSPREAQAKLRARFEPYRLSPLLRREGDQDVLLALPAMVPLAAPAAPRSVGRPWVNVVLFVATVFTVLLAGVQQDTGNLLADLLSGWPFAGGLLLILLTHEFGHYFAARYHGVAATLPYFIPMPLSLLGTFGAVINIKSPMRDRRTLLDIGAAGPLAGLIVALPVLLVGLALSPVEPMGQCPPDTVCYLEGNSLLYLAAKYLVHGRVLPGDGLDVMLHPLAFAGWAGVLISALNLLPVGTLDGGHIAYALLGDKARYLFYPILLALVGLGIFWNGWWLWAGLLFFFGRMHARPLDNATPLDGKRKLVALVALLVFVVTFTPLPMTIIP